MDPKDAAPAPAGFTALITSFDSGEGFTWDGDKTGALYSSVADPNIKTAVSSYSTRFCSLATIVE
jgi:hypothetical protein